MLNYSVFKQKILQLFFFINKPLAVVVAQAVFVAVSLPIFFAVHLVVSA